MPVYPASPTVVLTPGLIAQSLYNPAVLVDYDGTPVSMTDADATNLLITFVTPPSGIILVKLNAHSYADSGCTTCWGLREGSADVANSKVVVGGGGVGYRSPYTLRISGLVPGSVHTYKWSLGRDYRPGAQSMLLRVGGVFGPAVMEVWDANPTYSQQILTGVRPFKFATRTAGTVSCNSTSYTAVDTALDLILVATIGDVIEYGVNGDWGNEAVWAYLDVATMVSGSVVNRFAGSASDEGVQGWRGFNGSYAAIGGGYMKTLVAGDISAGTVTLRLQYKTLTAAVKTLQATSQNPLQVYAKNLGQAAA